MSTEEPPSLKLTISITLILIFLSFLFASFETSLLSSDKIKLKSRYKKYNKILTISLKMLDNKDITMSGILLLTNLCHAAYSAIISIYVSKKYGLYYLPVAVLVSAVLIFIIGEIIPKLTALFLKEKLFIILSFFLYPLCSVISPISIAFHKLSNFIFELLTDDDKVEENFSIEDIKDMANEALKNGNIEKNTNELLKRAIKFDNKTVGNVMRKWQDTTKVLIKENASEIFEHIKNIKYSRIPVIDKSKELIGLINYKIFLQEFVKNRLLKTRDVLIEPFFIDKDMKIDDALSLMSSKLIHFAFIKDDNQEVSGIITIEDIIEELMGDIKDEKEI